MKKLAYALLCAALLAGCTGGNKDPEPTVEPTPETTPEPTAETSSVAEIYDLPADNVLKEGTKESVTNFMEHGTGILFFGFPECPWCMKYVPYLNEVVKEGGTDFMYYNIFVDKTEDHDYYLKVAERIEEQYPGIVRYDNEGNMRIWMPLTLFINNGKIVAYDDETNDLSADEISPDEYWNEDRLAALKTRLAKETAEIVKAQKENGGGCDEGCEVEPGAAGLTDLLKEAHDHVHQGVAGTWYTTMDINYRMMDWYMQNKPSAEDLTKTAKEFVSGIDDPEEFQFSLESLQGTGEYALTDDGKAELSDNDFDPNVKWTADDVNAFYSALLAGLE